MNKVQAAKTIIKLAKALATDSKSTRTAGAKYSLTEETKQYHGHILYRVKYAEGKLGGWIESEKNLQGNAKVLDDSMVYGNAVVKDTAIVKKGSIVRDNALVSGKARVTNSHIMDYAKIKDKAIVSDSQIEDNATVLEYGVVRNRSYVYGNSKVTGIVDKSDINGKSIIQGLVTKSQFIDGRVPQGVIINDNKLVDFIVTPYLIQGLKKR